MFLVIHSDEARKPLDSTLGILISNKKNKQRTLVVEVNMTNFTESGHLWPNIDTNSKGSLKHPKKSQIQYLIVICWQNID